MNYSKEMIDLVREIRRRVPANDKPSIKLANPELLNEILDIYSSSKDSVNRALIRELFIMAGGDWLELILDDERSQQQFQTKVYRGKTSLSPITTQPEINGTKPVAKVKQKPKKIYRGQVVA